MILKIFAFLIIFFVFFADTATIFSIFQNSSAQGQQSIPPTPSSLPSNQPDPVELFINPQQIDIEVGNSFSLDVVASSNSEQITAAEIYLKYDPIFLKAISITRGAMLPVVLSSGVITSNSASIIVGATPGSPGSKAGTLATVTFKAIRQTESPTQINIDSSTQIAALNATGNIAGVLTPGFVNIKSSNIEKTASFSFSPLTQTIDANKEFSLKVMVQSDIDEANLFSAKINFDSTKLEVIRIEDGGSFVTNWVEKNFDNIDGKISVIGGVISPGFKTGASIAEMVTIYFRAKNLGEGLIDYENTSAIYRNSDNVDILGNLFSATVTINPIPYPSIEPTPTPIISPTALPTPVPTSEPLVCTIKKAFWTSNVNPLTEGQIAKLTVWGEGLCTNKQVNFQIFEDDGFTGTDGVKAKNLFTSFNSSNEAFVTWVSEFQPDGFFGVNNPPEYFFKASLFDNSSEVKSSDPKLQVNEALIGQYKKGDTNRDGQVNLADLSMMLTYWNKSFDFIDELDQNLDGVINALDFSEMIKILKSSLVLN